uniref:Uncharacterized protein n=1 Tax=Oryza rufipogon TaxID=4529 RepID=A0A0E0RFZ6_ORYRU
MVTGTGSVVAVELALEEEIHAGGRLIERKLCNFPALKAMEVPGTERSGCGRPLRCLDEPYAAGCGCPSSRPELRCPLGPKFRSLIVKLMVMVSCTLVTGISVDGSTSGGELWHASACRALARFSANPCMHMCLHGAWILTRHHARVGEDRTGKRWPEVRKTMLISHLGCGGHDGSVARSGVVHSGQNGDEIMAAVLGACSRADNGMATFPSLQWMK